jgi:hypothetical protein
MTSKHLPNTGDTSIIATLSNLGAAFDPDGVEVWCTTFNQPASTNDGFCQFCGATDHAEPTQIEATCTYPVDLPDGSCDNDAVQGSMFCAAHTATETRERAASDDMDRIQAAPDHRPYGVYGNAANWSAAALGDSRDV